jgi:hypothetical protein
METMEQTNKTPNTTAAVPVTDALQALEPLSLNPEAIVEYLRAVQAQIPDYGQLGASSIALLRNAHVDPNFVLASNNIAGVSPLVQQVMGHTPEAMNQEAEETRRWSVVEDTVRALLKGIATANLVRRNRVGTRALQGYNVALQLAKIPEHSELLPHVDALKKMNKFSRLRRKASKPAATGTPATPASPAAS